jgi:hypothetical protein
VHINGLVSHAQSASIKGRCIQGNFLLVRNLARAYHRKRVPALLFKLDIAKALDSISWEYLLEMLQYRNFPTRWRNWLSVLLSTSASLVRINGVQGAWIKHFCGLRQGDPLSPYLFILAIDTIQQILQKATDEGLLTPIRDRVCIVRLSLYADDAVLFVNPTQQDVDNLLEIMRHFGRSTGLCMNMAKSSVLPIRCGQVNLDQILSNFPREISSFPTTYLGLPLTLGWLRKTHLQSCLDQPAGKLARWQARLLNQGGRRELVKTVLSTLPTHLLAVIKLPKRFYKDVDKLRRRFLWVGDQEIHGGECKVNWSRVCCPLNYGGMGLTDLENFGRALHLRWLWQKWHLPDKPWCDPDMAVDDIDEALFAAATLVKIHNGKTARFWTSSSLSGISPPAMFLRLYNHSRNKRRSVREAL